MNLTEVPFVEGGNDVVIFPNVVSLDGQTSFIVIDMEFQEYGVSFTYEVSGTTKRLFLPWERVQYIRQVV